MKVAFGGAPVRVADSSKERPSGLELLKRLETICSDRNLPKLAMRLAGLARLVAPDLEMFERSFAALPRDQRLVGRAASHLLDLGGKRLRPMCLMLASRLGTPRDEDICDLAVAVELVHSATLLHDDVVDDSSTRRGSATAKTIYGNAASIFAGDWLLIEGLRRVQRTGLPRVLEELLATIEEMIFAESLQLQSREKLRITREEYFEIVEGKTASVFRWAMFAGGMAAGASESELDALSRYGVHLGKAFQAIDDLLDLTGDTSTTGKELFTDLKEGKITFPVILAIEREPSLREIIEDTLSGQGNNGLSAETAAQVISSLRRTHAIKGCLDLARLHSTEAVASLAAFPDGKARRALETVAESMVDRDL